MNTIVSTSFLLPQTVISNGAVTGTGFQNPDNILLKDGDVASSNGTADITVGDFNTNLPQNAVIVGIEMQLTAKTGAVIIPPNTLTVYAYDNTNGRDDYYPYLNPVTNLTTVLTTQTLGTQNYLFASSFTVDQINNMKFNLVSNGNVDIDTFQMKVYYYIPATPGIPPIIGTGCDDCNSIIQVQEMSLEHPFLIGQTKFYLKKGSFAYADGTPVQPGDVGACGGEIPFVFDEGVRKSPQVDGFEENAVVDTNLSTWTVLPSGVIEVDIGAITNRGLDFKTPYTHVAALMSDHAANTKVIISNSGRYEYRLLKKCHIGVLVSAPISALYNDVPIVDPVTKFNFKGAGVSVVQNFLDPLQADITITGAGGTVPPSISSSSSTTSGNTQVTNWQWLHTSIGIDRYLLIEVSLSSARTVTGLTFDGTPMTFLAGINSGSARSEFWGIVAPVVITNGVLDITFSGLTYFCAGAQTIVNVNQTTPIGTPVTASGNSNAPSLVVTTTADYSLIFDGISTAKLPILITPGAGQSENWHHYAMTDNRQGASSVEPAGTQPDNVTMSYSLTQSTPWAMIGIEVIGITTGGGGGGGHVIQENAVSFPQQPRLNFINFFDITDNVGNTSTDVNLDMVAIGNDTTLINTLTSNGLFQSLVNAFVSGSGGANKIDQTPDNGTYGLLAGAVNGINTTFTVSLGAYITGTLLVFLNGLVQLQGASDDWVETTPGSGTFDFITPPLTGDIVTVSYATATGVPQLGIQFEDEGSPLGTPGTVDEVDFTGAGVTATRVGNKVTVNIPNSGGGGGGLGSTQYLAIGKANVTGSSANFSGDRFNVTGSSGSQIRGGHVVYEANTGRIYVPINDAPNHAPSNQGTTLRIFRNTTGSFVLENEISLATPNTGGQNNISARWTTNGTNLYCVYFYSRSSDFGAPYPGGIGISKFALDGTLIGDMQIYTTATIALPYEKPSWDNPGSALQMAIEMIGDSIFMTYQTTAGATEFREYDVSAFPVVTLVNTYAVGSPTNGTKFNYDSSANEWLLSGSFNTIVKFTISGGNFVQGSSISYDQFKYGSPNDDGSSRPFTSVIAAVVPSNASNQIYVVNGNGFNWFTSSHQNYYFNYLLSSVDFPKF